MADNSTRDVDVAIVGGGPAGLQAALTLGRIRRTVLLLDSAEYRNATASHMHNFLTHDGDDPADVRAEARKELEHYDTVEHRSDSVLAISPHGSGWHLETAGGDTVHARRVILATGVRDTLPDKPGLRDLWGDVVAHCPFCHGHEFRDRHVAVLGAGPHTPRLAAMMSRITTRLTVLTEGTELAPETREHLEQIGTAVRDDIVTSVQPCPAGARIEFSEGEPLEVAGLFVSPQMAQSAPFAEQLGLEMLASGGVRVDEFGRTSRPGIYAAGDMAHVPALPMPMASVLTAAASGLIAASAAVQDLVAEDHPWVMAA